MPTKLDQDWLVGQVSLGMTTGWTVEEMRLVAELGFLLAQEGRNKEAITIFEGLTALAPVTPYFQSALGALKLRIGELGSAIEHLSAALESDPKDTFAFVNRGEAYMKLGDFEAAISDLQSAQDIAKKQSTDGTLPLHATRAQALQAQIRRSINSVGLGTFFLTRQVKPM